MERPSVPEIVKCVYPTIIAASAAVYGTNPFRLPENSWELRRYQFQAAIPFSLFLNVLFHSTSEPDNWKMEARKTIFKIPADLAERLIKKVSLMDLCPTAGEREEMVEHYNTTSLGSFQIDPDGDYSIGFILYDLMAVRFPRFLYDYINGIKFARLTGLDELSATAFMGVSKNFLCQLSANPGHYNEDCISHFATGFAGAARMIVKEFNEAYQ